MQKRRSFLSKVWLSSFGLGMFLSTPAQSEKKRIKGRFVHMVFFWLKPDADVDLFIKNTKSFLEKVPEIQLFHLGSPAMTPREVVDNSYSVSLIATFASKEDQDAYQNHPEHQVYVAENKEKWTDIKIYDSWEYYFV